MNWVDIDDKTAIPKVIEHLTEQGHERVAIIALEKGCVADLRYQGYREGLQACGSNARYKLVYTARSRE